MPDRALPGLASPCRASLQRSSTWLRSVPMQVAPIVVAQHHQRLRIRFVFFLPQHETDLPPCPGVLYDLPQPPRQIPRLAVAELHLGAEDGGLPIETSSIRLAAGDRRAFGAVISRTSALPGLPAALRHAGGSAN